MDGSSSSHENFTQWMGLCMRAILDEKQRDLLDTIHALHSNLLQSLTTLQHEVIVQSHQIRALQETVAGNQTTAVDSLARLGASIRIGNEAIMKRLDALEANTREKHTRDRQSPGLDEPSPGPPGPSWRRDEEPSTALVPADWSRSAESQESSSSSTLSSDANQGDAGSQKAVGWSSQTSTLAQGSLDPPQPPASILSPSEVQNAMGTILEALSFSPQHPAFSPYSPTQLSSGTPSNLDILRRELGLARPGEDLPPVQSESHSDVIDSARSPLAPAFEEASKRLAYRPVSGFGSDCSSLTDLSTTTSPASSDFPSPTAVVRTAFSQPARKRVQLPSPKRVILRLSPRKSPSPPFLKEESPTLSRKRRRDSMPPLNKKANLKPSKKFRSSEGGKPPERQTRARSVSNETKGIKWPKLKGKANGGSEFIECSSCEKWYHLGCTGLTQEDDVVTREDIEFFCPPCSAGFGVRPAIPRAITLGRTDICSRPDCNIKQEDEVFVLQSVVGRQRLHSKPGSYQYLIKWEGYPIAASTWEPLEKLGSSAERLVRAFLETALRQGHDLQSNTILLREAKAVGLS